MNIKQLLGKEIGKLIIDGQTVGLGTGSTAVEGIKAIGERIKKEGIVVHGVPTSNASEQLAKEMGIVIENDRNKQIDWGFDGSDEVEIGTLNLLKGGGGAMTREKLIAKRCKKWIVIVDESKTVTQLGEKFSIPVEVKEDQMFRIQENIFESYNPLDITVRMKDDGTQFVTDFGNMIIDVKVAPGAVKDTWEYEWERIPGVVGTGLFLGGYPDEDWIGKADGTIEKIKGPGER